MEGPATTFQLVCDLFVLFFCYDLGTGDHRTTAYSAFCTHAFICEVPSASASSGTFLASQQHRQLTFLISAFYLRTRVCFSIFYFYYHSIPDTGPWRDKGTNTGVVIWRT